MYGKYTNHTKHNDYLQNTSHKRAWAAAEGRPPTPSYLSMFENINYSLHVLCYFHLFIDYKKE